MANDWDIIDPDNEWGFVAPDPGTGPMRYNNDLRREQGLGENECPYYGELVQTRIVHRHGMEMFIFYYSTGWRETWYWKHCPKYRYREGIWVDNVWYPPDWDEIEWVEEYPVYK